MALISPKITNRELRKLHQGLSSLDGIRQGSNEVIGFVFDSKTKLALMHNTIAVERAKEALDRVEQKSLKEKGIYDGVERTPETIKKLGEHMQMIETLNDEIVDLAGLREIKASEILNQPQCDAKAPCKCNPIPQSVLTQLRPILVDDVSE